MAWRASWLLGAVCLFWHSQGALGKDGLDEEYFPLSSGVEEGVKVTVKVDATQDVHALIDFLTPDRDIAFRLDLDTQSQIVNRISRLPVPEVVEHFGGWGLNTSMPMTFEFYKTKFTWQVSIGSNFSEAIRYPWFDFAHRNADTVPLPYVSVSTGFTNVDVDQERTMCSTPCHPSECQAQEGSSVCGAGVNSSCFTTVPAGLMYAESCSTSQETGSGGASCCDGMQKTLTLSDANVDTWVKVVDDATLVDRACAAYGDEAKACGAHAGRDVQVLAVNPLQGSYSAWVPSAVNASLAAPNFTLPAWSFYELPATTLTEAGPPMRMPVTLADGTAVWTDDFGADGHNGLVYRAGASAVAAGIQNGLFVDGISYVDWMGEERWFSYNYYVERTIKVKAGNKTVRLVVTDRPVVLPSACLGDRPFVDRAGNTCADYTANQWCNRHGQASQDWCDTYQQNRDVCDQDSFYYGGDDPNTFMYPMSECCACGGGDRAPPAEFQDGLLQTFQ